MPNTSWAQLLPLPWEPASTHRCFRRESLALADSSSSLSPSWGRVASRCLNLGLKSTNPSVSTSSGGAFCLPPSLGGVQAALVGSHSRGGLEGLLGVHYPGARLRVS